MNNIINTFEEYEHIKKMRLILDKKAMPKISVIVPVYNTEKYLVRCMDSIINQKLRDIEIICLDNCSTDKSAQILDEYAQKDSRIIVIHKEQNLGYGNSINMGLNIALGEYIGIVESDDYILEEYYERLYNVAKENLLDVIKTDVTFWWSDTGYTFLSRFKYLEEFYNRILYSDERKIRYKFRMNVWAGIYRRDFLTDYDIRLNESKNVLYEDNGFWFQTLAFARTTMWLAESYYYYRQDNPNQSVKALQRYMDVTHEFDWLEEKLIEKNVEKQIIDECNCYRLIRNQAEFYRVADDCKLLFSDRLCNEYIQYGNTLEDNDEISSWYELFAKDPHMFTQDLIKCRQQLMDRLNSTNKILIYGAGERGQWLFRNLCYRGLYSKIIGFAISDEGEHKRVCGLPVISIAKHIEDKDDMLVIISTDESSIAYKHMNEKILVLGYNNYMSANGILDNFYSLC